MAIITVSSTAALNSALKAAHDGDTIQLAPGQYDGMVAKYLSFANGITITSQDPAHQAVLTNFTLMNDSGMTIKNVEMQAVSPGYSVFQVNNSNNIHFDHVDIHGSLDNNPNDDVSGIAFNGSTNVSLTNSQLHELQRAISISKSDGVTIANNYVHDIGIDGVDAAQVSHVTISGNAFTNFHPVSGVHPDAIQFWTAGTTVASHDITISGNVMTLGNGAPMQGIFMGDETGTLPYNNVTVSNNLIDGTGYNGLRLNHFTNLTLSGNTLTTSANGYKTDLLIQNSTNVVSTNNTALVMSFSTSTNVTESGDHLNTVQTDSGNAVLYNFLHANGMDALYSSLSALGVSSTTSSTSTSSSTSTTSSTSTVSSSTTSTTSGATTSSTTTNGSVTIDGANMTLKAGALNIDATGDAQNNYITGNIGSNHLYGMAGNDTLDGGGGADTLAGGTGDDTYILNSGQVTIVENPGEGNDTVIVKGNFTLPTNVENLVINNTVANSWTGTGNTLNNQLTGNGGANLLDGQAGNDTIDGGLGNDTVIGGAGDDRLTGGQGDDVFRFGPGSGHDVITDFGNGHDQIDIYAFKQAGLTPTVHDVGSDVVISFTNGDSITVLGHHIADLTASKYGWVI